MTAPYRSNEVSFNSDHMRFYHSAQYMSVIKVFKVAGSSTQSRCSLCPQIFLKNELCLSLPAARQQKQQAHVFGTHRKEYLAAKLDKELEVIAEAN